jgi:hypothetical protein
MKLIDTNGIDFMVKHTIAVREIFHATPDVHEEFEAGHDRKPPRNVENLFEMTWFDRAAYFDGYKKMLNTHGGRSFYNMSGFGDISILAALEAQRNAASKMLPGLAEEIEVITGDVKLSNKIRREFIGANDAFGRKVSIRTPADFFKTFPH